MTLRYKLNDLLTASGVEPLSVEGGNPAVSSVTEDSRRVDPGAVFVATHGVKIDSHLFVSDAVEKGASVIVVEDDVPAYHNITMVRVKDSRDALGRMAHAFNNNPTSKMTVIGVTGTNGKTTITYILEAIFKAVKFNPGIFGTIEYRYNNQSFESVNTTPSSTYLAKLFHQMKTAKVKAVAMEVSSHAADQRRISGIQFDACILTNITQDHLDYHHTMEEYAAAKWKIFNDYLVRYKDSQDTAPAAVFNIDDSYGQDFSKNFNGRKLTYSLEADSDLRAQNIQIGHEGTTFDVLYQNQTYSVSTALVGLFNIYNILGAMGAALGVGIPMESVLVGIKNLSMVPGRLESIREGQDYLVLVDYAHTPDALERVLINSREMTRSRLIVVFGCGGDRDPTKRPLMGAIAGRLADKVIVTNDNPRTEDPLNIAGQIFEGLRSTSLSETDTVQILDRRAAIHQALSMAEKGDVVLIAGKGHEDYQILGEHKIHFDDREIARNFLRERQQQD